MNKISLKKFVVFLSLLTLPLVLNACWFMMASSIKIPVRLSAPGVLADLGEPDFVHFNLNGDLDSKRKEYSEKAVEVMSDYLSENPKYKDYCILYFWKKYNNCEFIVKLWNENINAAEKNSYVETYLRSALQNDFRYNLAKKINNMKSPLSAEELTKSGLLLGNTSFIQSHKSEITLDTTSINGYYKYDDIPHHLIYQQKIRYSVAKNSENNYNIKLVDAKSDYNSEYLFPDKATLVTY
jgi:hypothetical protein